MLDVMKPELSSSSDGATWVAASSIAGVAEVLPMRVGSRASQTLFEDAGLLEAWHRPPQDKVADDELRRLHRVLRDNLGLPTARAVARDAGGRAADELWRATSRVAASV
jgi:hypothetical protein